MTYTPPSRCDRCVPTVTLTHDSAMTPISETAHQTTFPNAPKEND